MQAREEGRTGPIRRLAPARVRPAAPVPKRRAGRRRRRPRGPRRRGAPRRGRGGRRPRDPRLRSPSPRRRGRPFRKTEEPGRLHAPLPEVRGGPAGPGRGRVEAEVREVRGIGEAAGGRDPPEDRLVAARLRGPDDGRAGPPRRPSGSSRVERVKMLVPFQKALLPGAFLAAFLAAAPARRQGRLQGRPSTRRSLTTPRSSTRSRRSRRAPQDAQLHNDLGCLVAWDGFWRDALRSFDTAAELAPKDSRPSFNAGLVQALRGEWGERPLPLPEGREDRPGQLARLVDARLRGGERSATRTPPSTPTRARSGSTPRSSTRGSTRSPWRRG